MIALLTPGGAIPARRYTFSTDVGLRHPVMERHASFTAGSSLLTCVDRSHTGHAYSAVVVVRLPRPMKGNGATPIFRSLQNCQFHHRRLEFLEHFNLLIYIYYIYIILGTTVSQFVPYGCHIFLQRLLFCIHFHFFFQIHFACVFCI